MIKKNWDLITDEQWQEVSIDTDKKVHAYNREKSFNFLVEQGKKALEKAAPRVYCLEVEQESGFYYYIGSSNNPLFRISQHINRKGASFTKNYVRIKEVPILTKPMHHLESWERLEFLTRVRKVGADWVRGWQYSHPNLSKNDKIYIEKNVIEAFDLCRNCLSECHFVSNCQVKYIRR